MENAVAADPVLDLAEAEYYSIRGSETYHALELRDCFASIGKRAYLGGLAEDLSAFTARIALKSFNFWRYGVGGRGP